MAWLLRSHILDCCVACHIQGLRSWVPSPALLLDPPVEGAHLAFTLLCINKPAQFSYQHSIPLPVLSGPLHLCPNKHLASPPCLSWQILPTHIPENSNRNRHPSWGNRCHLPLVLEDLGPRAVSLLTRDQAE